MHRYCAACLDGTAIPSDTLQHSEAQTIKRMDMIGDACTSKVQGAVDRWSPKAGVTVGGRIATIDDTRCNLLQSNHCVEHAARYSECSGTFTQ